MLYGRSLLVTHCKHSCVDTLILTGRFDSTLPTHRRWYVRVGFRCSFRVLPVLVLKNKEKGTTLMGWVYLTIGELAMGDAHVISWGEEGRDLSEAEILIQER